VAEIGIFDVDRPAAARADGAAPPGGGDAAGEQVGTGTLTMAVLPARPGGMRVPPDRDVPTGWGYGEGGLDRPVGDAMAVRVLDRTAGRLSMPLVPYVHNSFGAAQGGVMALLAELSGLAAVESASAGAAKPDAVVHPAVARGLQVAYVALGRVGPITARAPLVMATPDGGGRAVVELADEGAGDRVTTVVNVDVAATVAGGAPA
jgi:acyl-coenzyme A thioesterase PaaI-like protein